MADKFEALALRAEAITDPTPEVLRELSDDALAALGWKQHFTAGRDQTGTWRSDGGGRKWFPPDAKIYRDPPNPAASIDDQAIVMPGINIAMVVVIRVSPFVAWHQPPVGNLIKGEACTEALARFASGMRGMAE